VAIFSLSRNLITKAGTVVAVLAHDQGLRVSHGALGKLSYAQSREEISLDGTIATDYRGKDVLAVGQALPDGVIEQDIADVFREADAYPTKKEGKNQKLFRPVVASELIGALPHELSLEQNVSLTQDFSKRVANEFHTANAWGIHPPDASARTEDEKKNIHVHVAILHRRIERDGKLSTLNRDFNNRDCWHSDKDRGREIRDTATKRLRLMWEQTVNDHLERAGRSERIDRRTLAAQGIERAPGVHRGAAETRRLRAKQSKATVRDLRAELVERAHELAERRMAALQKIDAIQKARLEERSTPQYVADIGSLEAWQRDAVGMLARYWAAEDRAMELRRRMRAAARRHAEMRAATKEEDTQLKMAGRQLSRSKKLIVGVDEAIGRLDKLSQDERLAVEPSPSSRPMTKARLADIGRAMSAIEPDVGGTGHDDQVPPARKADKRKDDMEIKDQVEKAQEAPHLTKIIPGNIPEVRQPTVIVAAYAHVEHEIVSEAVKTATARNEAAKDTLERVSRRRRDRSRDRDDHGMDI